eukprot:CAMPEP_0119345534 /NCGR_PEP_ID=MMETSP1333-20130426/107538_1 /TAXON_ID=418940 /ORGANISM="Scyphosphaera apsteinii, Strain RCC1455" /LENGTH=207 /DNA_ID=CAMNT_0007358009 /DNA_START=297 /DNA_END=920 /DNA_ORIENTATION=+
MIRTMQGDVDRLEQERDSAQYQLHDAVSELEAYRILAKEENEELEERVQELTDQLAAAQCAASIDSEASGVGDRAQALAQQVVALTRKLEAIKMQAARSEAAEKDAVAELEASRELAIHEEAALQETIRDLLERLRLAEECGVQTETVDSRQAERMKALEEQVASLLQLLAEQQAANSELMVLRPKAVRCDELELQLQQHRADNNVP